MSDPRGEIRRDAHIGEKNPQEAVNSDMRTETISDTYEVDPSIREALQQELMDLGVWLTEHPRARKNLKPIRGGVVLDPGIYYNVGTGLVERIYAPQHMALGSRVFRVKSDPGSPVEEIRRKVLEGK